jgi:hypothetical protein
MKNLIFVVIVTVAVASSISPATAKGTKCYGDALRATPPVVNYPTHIRNVVWRNMRAMCAQTSFSNQSSNTNKVK